MTLTAPRLFHVDTASGSSSSLEEAAALIREGKLVAFPTETVYGLGADAMNPEAIERLNHVKGRPPQKPYSLHLASVKQVSAIVKDLPPLAERLMQKFWPGPLTIVVPHGKNKTVGLRVPDHPIAQAFLAACAVPVAAPSANRSGETAPRTAQEVIEGLGGSIDGCIDSGPTPVGLPSTVLAVEGNRVTVYREGAIGLPALRDAIGSSFVYIGKPAEGNPRGK